MNNIIKRTWKQNGMVQIEDLRGQTFQNESGGHTFVIRGEDEDGNQIALSGSPAGVFLRPDNTDQALTCSIANGMLYATLPAACYDVPGRAGITIYLTSDGQKTALYAAMVSVGRTSTGTVAPGTTADVVDLINRINEVVATIPPDYSALSNEVVGLESALNFYLRLYEITEINSTDDFKPFYAKAGDNLTIKTTDGSLFSQTDQLELYDVNKNIIERWYTNYVNVSKQRTFDYTNTKEAHFIKIKNNGSNTINYTVMNNSTVALKNIQDTASNAQSTANNAQSGVNGLSIISNALTELSKINKSIPISASSGLVPFMAKSGDSVTIKTADGSVFPQGDQVAFYDKDNGYTTNFYTTTVGSSTSRTVTLSMPREARFVKIISASETIVNYVLENNSSEYLNDIETEINGVRNGVASLSRVNYNVDISASYGLIPFGVKPGDSITIKTANGSTFSHADRLELYDRDGKYITYYGTIFVNQNVQRTVTYNPNPEKEACFIAIKPEDSSAIIDYVVINNSSTYLNDIREESHNAIVSQAYLSKEDCETEVAYGYGLIPFYAKNGDAITIRTKDGSLFSKTDSVTFYDREGQRITFFYTNFVNQNKYRDVIYDNVTDAYFVSIVPYETSTIITYIVQNNSSTFFDENQDIPASWKTSLQAMMSEQNTSLSFALQSDTHYIMSMGKYAGFGLNRLSTIMGLDFIANLGDIIRGYQYDIDSNENTRKAMTNIVRNYVQSAGCPVIITPGNHDSNVMYANAHSVDEFTQDEIFARLIKPCITKNPKAVCENGKLYYYMDTPSARIIAVNSQDGGGSLAWFGISNEQLNWFTNIALNTTKPVLVLSHAPLVSGISENYSATYVNIINALKAFKNNGGTVIACMCGHMHSQESKTEDGILHIVFTGSLTDIAETVDVVLVDTENKTIKTYGFGAATNREFDYDPSSENFGEILT